DNLPPPDATARLLKSTSISKVRLYGVDAGLIRALAGSSISVVVGVANGDIPSLAADPAAASRWVAANVLPFVPATSISAVAVGNEVLESGDASLAAALLPAMQNLRAAALAAGGAAAGVRFSTVNTMGVMAQSDPPSTGAFHPDITPQLQGILGFLSRTGAPFMINPYPWFAYQSDPRPDTLAFCLFQPNAGRLDAGSRIRYTNMFDAQLDAVKAAMTRAGYGDVDVVVAETGWPTRGDAGEPGATPENARAYVSGLVAHLRSGAGTPLMPGKAVETYLFALYDEDLKPGPASERAFGLYHTDLIRGVRRRADVVGGRGGECGRRRRGGGEGERRVVRGAGRRVGRGPAGGPGLRVRAGGRGLRRHPARGRVLRAQHGARPRRVRHEPALPGGGAAPLELRLPGLRHAHLQQPQLRRVRVHWGRPMIGVTVRPPTATSWQPAWRAIRFVSFRSARSEDHND
ncbi:unnamed protein product, partial [Urochloa humidicola]